MQSPEDPEANVLTIAAISIIALFFESVLHHAFGHGGAFLLMGARLKWLSSLSVVADASQLASWQTRIVFAAGSVADITVALTCLFLLRIGFIAGACLRYFLWLTMSVGFLLPAAYLLFTWFPLGDWYEVTAGLYPEWAWRFFLTVAGAAFYAAGMLLTVQELEPFLGTDPQKRWSRARLLSTAPYLTIGAVATVAPLAGQAEMMFVVLGLFYFPGLAGLCFIHRNVGEPKFKKTVQPLSLRRNILWIVVGAIALIVFVRMLGPGIPLGH
jgi:hypothetical protein